MNTYLIVPTRTVLCTNYLKHCYEKKCIVKIHALIIQAQSENGPFIPVMMYVLFFFLLTFKHVSSQIFNPLPRVVKLITSLESRTERNAHRAGLGLTDVCSATLLSK